MLAIGLMSGTSLDGIDAALIDTDGELKFKSIANLYHPFDTDFQKQLMEIIHNRSNDWLYIEKELTIRHANCVKALLEQAAISSLEIDVIGFHGQTIYHKPKQGITWQIGNPHLLAAITNIDVVSDFRRRDVSRGGQGAPLIPIFHKCLMQDHTATAIVNIGGVANITYVDEHNLIAFDTGPGNALINDAMMEYYNKPFDNEGLIAKQGTIDESIIEEILEYDFFKMTPPKSLDRNNFTEIMDKFVARNPADIIASLTMLTVRSIISSLKFLPRNLKKIYVCGGGSKNHALMQWLVAQMELRNNSITIENEFEFGNIDFIEAQGFAYLAIRYLKNLPSSFPSSTGTNRETLSGVLFRA